MKDDRLIRHSRWLATATLVLLVSMLLLNLACWLYPSLLENHLDFNLTSLIKDLKVDIAAMPWWQVMGGMALSSIPLLILTRGLMALRCLFQAYAQGEYFSQEAAGLLGEVGKNVGLWVLSSILLYPLLSVWITLLMPPGERMLSLVFSPSHLVALFLAAAVMLVARIMGNACQMARENQQFI
ncbi:DUF2975 domain-containing protein [Pseudomonas chlororaphis]|nr:DUF2975 domain-containing protein [Pseudomonas chlororaphis]